MRFIGSKNKLLSFIDSVLEDNQVNENIMCDIFSGTTVVARHFKCKGYSIVSNDNLYFSYVLQKAYIENNGTPTFKKLQKEIEVEGNLCSVINYLNNIPPIEGFVYENYAPGGATLKANERRYFSDSNAKKIDAIRQEIELYKNNNWVNEQEYYILLTSLIEAVPFVSNIAGTYGAFLKTWDRRALKCMQLSPPELITNDRNHTAYCRDANELIRELETDILYLDPPYNSRQYITNYHILETIAKKDYPNIYGKTGIRPYSKEKSDYCIKNKAEIALEDLILNAKTKHIVMSYNSEGLIPQSTLLDILSLRGEVRFYENNYRRYRSDSDANRKYKVKDNNVVENIYYVCTNN